MRLVSNTKPKDLVRFVRSGRMMRCMTATPTERTTSGWIPEVDTFAKRLVLVRLKMGWHTADPAAREYGLPKESYRWWEKGKSVPRDLIDICWKISQRTGVDFGWLYGGEAMAGEQPSSEALKWLRGSDQNEAGKKERGIKAGYGEMNDRPMFAGRPAENRPLGRPRTGSTGPGPGRPARVPRPGMR